MAAKRILYCEGNVDGTVGGSFFSLLYLVERLDRDKYQPVVVFHRDHALIPRYREAGIDTRVIPLPEPMVVSNPLLKPVQKASNLLRYLPLFAWRLSRLLKKERIDLVHLNNSITRNHPWMLAAKLAGVPCMTHERGINPTYSWLSRWLGRGLARVVCISDAVRQNFQDKGVVGLKLITIYNGINPDVLTIQRQPEALRQAFGIAPNRRLLAMIGNIKEWKGQESVVRAMATVKQHHPDALCLFVGATAESDRYYQNRLDRLVDELGLRDQVLFTGYQSDVADFIHASESLVHASIDPEPFGRVLIEAMALRKPVIGANGGAVPEIVDSGTTGYLFEPGNSDSLAAAIEALLAMAPEARFDMGEAGWRRLLAHFHIDQNLEATERLYRDVLKQPS